MILVANTQLFLEKFTINYLQNPRQSVLEFGIWVDGLVLF